MEGQETPERCGTGEHDTVEVDDQVGLALGPHVILIMLAKITNGSRVQAKTVPELGHKDPVLVPDLDHGLEHERPVDSVAKMTTKEI